MTFKAVFCGFDEGRCLARVIQNNATRTKLVQLVSYLISQS